MPEELDLEGLDNDIEKENKVEKRIKDLSEKVRTSAEERDAERRLKEEEAQKRADAEKERDFYRGFSDVVSTNPAAKDHKDDILAKVKGGYSVEDATYAVLGKAGKLGQPQPIVDSPAGGSAPVTAPQGGSKPLGEMTKEEKRQKLLEAEARGDISIS